MTNLRSAFFRHLIPCFVICAIGIFAIESLSIYLQNWYAARFLETARFVSTSYVIQKNPDKSIVYRLFFFARVLLIPLWSLFCLYITAKRFYRKEIQEPVDVLTQASERILESDLDFRVECDAHNELGGLCRSFEQMRQNLYESSYRLWKSLEERKRLNAAFAHDLRTPLTVLKGYTELTTQMNGKLSPEKQAEILEKMAGQVSRLERCTEKMNGIHKLEDIIPDPAEISFGTLCAQLEENGRLLCKDISFTFSEEGDAAEMLCTDTELVMQVFMNLVSNAQRYATSRITCKARLTDELFTVTVSDDGNGFSEEALRKAWLPFYRADNDNDKEHFGLGLYICRIFCRKTGGDIAVQNNEQGGGSVTASFSKKLAGNR